MVFVRDGNSNMIARISGTVTIILIFWTVIYSIVPLVDSPVQQGGFLATIYLASSDSTSASNLGCYL